MASTPRPPRKPVVGSRNPTARPRRVASGVPEPAESAHLQTPEPPESARLQTPKPAEPAESAHLQTPTDDEEPRTSGARTTIALVVALVLLLGVAGAEAYYVWGRSEPVVSAGRPVVTGEMAHRTAVDTASQDVGKILSTSYKDYDAQVDDATSRMTDAFAAEYRQTAEQIKDAFVAAKTEVQSQVVAAGVMSASSERVEALIFVNQATTRDGKDTSVSQYRVKMTMVHTSGGWLVAGIDTN
ncbi:hypothetical protein H5V45_02150 [Nocardioides sp. KIGAM211]|uniref:Mce-associated membrane protein n=1 Tax=Nocardioides luti TaxID=2761101 RepID=A0A7X0VAG9_9ACTN|nr:hypothetical protein [Nocardioides luti]MBB6626113.1 hypothetical protein [Nocardioides luti]